MVRLFPLFSYIDSIKSNTYNISILENLSPAVWCRIIKRAIIARRRTSSTDDLELAVSTDRIDRTKQSQVIVEMINLSDQNG